MKPYLDAPAKKEVSADQFYESLKEALHAVGLRFHEMHLARVTVSGSDFIVRYRDRSVTLHFGEST